MDYIVVNDGSKDKTAAVCRARGYRLLTCRSISGWPGRSKPGCAMRLKTDYDCAMQLDADGQHRPEIHRNPCWKALEQGADIVIGSRFLTVKKPQDAADAWQLYHQLVYPADNRPRHL